MGGHVYDGKAETYGLGRVGYAPEAVKRIAEIFPPSNCMVAADVGSGTGIFTAELVRRGYRVYGVEPSDEMRDKARMALERYDGFTSLGASAEDTGLPDASVDFVTAASAFHWFDAAAFQRECRRILKPGGRVFLLYNVRDEGDALSREQAAICLRHCPAFTGLAHGAHKAEAACPAFFPNGYEKDVYDFDLSLSGETFLARSLSSSYSPAQGDAAYPAYRGELANLIARHAQGGSLLIRNRTVLLHGMPSC